MADRVLIIEDDDRLADMVMDYLGEAGFIMSRAATGADGLAAAGQADAVLLDLMLPDMDGLEVCREVRKTGGPPILMLTAKGDPMDRIVGLELGADDYLPKPFEPRELLARLRAILRRGRAEAPETLRFGRLEIDAGAMEARLDRKVLHLTAHQFKLLSAMAHAPGRVLTRDFLMDAVAGAPLEAFDRSIDVHVSRIRAEIEDDPKRPRRLLTIRGVGYVFAASQD